MARASYRKDNDHFKYTYPNPKNLKSSGDCVIRAICNATNIPWNKVYTSLCNLGYEMKRMPNDDEVFEVYLDSIGWKKYAQPRKADNKKYTLIELAEMAKKQQVTVIIRISHHLKTISNGYILDTWDCGNKSAGNFWAHI